MIIWTVVTKILKNNTKSIESQAGCLGKTVDIEIINSNSIIGEEEIVISIKRKGGGEIKTNPKIKLIIDNNAPEDLSSICYITDPELIEDDHWNEDFSSATCTLTGENFPIESIIALLVLNEKTICPITMKIKKEDLEELFFDDISFGENTESGDGAGINGFTCGNGILDEDEVCDPEIGGILTYGRKEMSCSVDGKLGKKTCKSNCLSYSECKIPNCGDNKIDRGEECDDNNNDDGDGCSSSCLLELNTIVGYYHDYDSGERNYITVLSTSPELIKKDDNIDFNWEAGSPHSSLPNDYFAILWDGKFEFDNPSNNYKFTIKSNDGIRIWIDKNDDRNLEVSEKIIDSLTNQQLDTTKSSSIPNGVHRVRIEYFEETGNAYVTVKWEWD